MQQYQVQAQSFSLVNQAKSYLLDTQEFITQSGTYTTAVQIYTTAPTDLQRSGAGVQPGVSGHVRSDHSLRHDEDPAHHYKSAFTPQADTYGLAAMMVQTVQSRLANALQSYNNMSMTPVSVIPANYNQLSAPTQQQLRAQASTMSANDSLIATSLQRASDVRSHTGDQTTLHLLEPTRSLRPVAEKQNLQPWQRINARWFS